MKIPCSHSVAESVVKLSPHVRRLNEVGCEIDSRSVAGPRFPEEEPVHTAIARGRVRIFLQTSPEHLADVANLDYSVAANLPGEALTMSRDLEEVIVNV